MVVKFKEEPERFIYELIKRINCHQLDVIYRFFKNIFHVKVYMPEGLEEKINLRHDLVHRFGQKVEGSISSINYEDLNELIRLSDSLIDTIQAKFADSLSKWIIQ